MVESERKIFQKKRYIVSKEILVDIWTMLPGSILEEESEQIPALRILRMILLFTDNELNPPRQYISPTVCSGKTIELPWYYDYLESGGIQ